MAIKASGQITITDFNDINISTTQPTNPSVDQLWLDSSVTPNVLKRWSGSAWVVVNDYSEDLMDISLKDKATALTGTFITCPTADNGLVHVKKIVGETVQKVTVEGKNICDNGTNYSNWIGVVSKPYTKIPNGFVLEVIDNDIPTRIAKNTIVTKRMVVGQQYTLSFDIKFLNNPNNANISTYFTGGLTDVYGTVRGIDGRLIWKFTYTGHTALGIYFQQAYPEVRAEITNIQVENGDTATTYEQFTPNSPSPEYPSTMEYAKEFDIMARNDNLIPIVSPKTSTSNGISFTTNSDGSITINGTATANAYYTVITAGKPILPFNVKLSISLKNTISGIGLYVNLANQYGTNVITSVLNSATKITNSISSEYGNLYQNVGIEVRSGTTANNIIVYPIINVGAEVNPYVQHKGDKKSILFPAMSVQNGTKNELSYDVSGKFTSRIRVDEVTYDGSPDEGWSLGQTQPTDTSLIRFSLTFAQMIVASRVLCDKFTGIPVTNAVTINKECIMSHSDVGALNIFILKSRLATPDVAGFKAWLSTNNIKVQYELATPIITTITPIHLTSYKGTTNLFTNSYPQVSMVVDFKSYGWAKQYYIEKELENNSNEIKSVDNSVTQLSKSLTGFQDTVNGSFKDGIIQEAESKAIAQYINTIANDKLSVDGRYTVIYGNANLIGTPKTNLLNAKNAFNTAYDALVLAINTAIADGKVNSTEKANVDSKFITYKSAIGTLSTRLEEAIKAIEDKMVSEVDSKVTANTTALNVAQGKISTIISESGITDLKNDGTTLYDKYVTTEQTLGGIKTTVSEHTSALQDITLIDKTVISGESIFTTLSDDSVVHINVNGKSVQESSTSTVVRDNLFSWVDGRNFTNTPKTTSLLDRHLSNHATASGFAYSTTSGSDGNGGVVFDGVDDRLTFNSIPATWLNSSGESQPVTLEIWLKLNSYMAGVIFGRMGFNTGILGTTGGINATLWTDESSTSKAVSKAIPLNTLTHVVATYNNGVIQLYVDGILIGTNSELQGKKYRALATPVVIGGYGIYPSNITMYSSRIYSKVLTQQEVTTNYNAGLSINSPCTNYPSEITSLSSFDVVSSIATRNLLRDTKELKNGNHVGVGKAIITTDNNGFAVATIPADGNYNSLSFYLTEKQISEVEGKLVTISAMVKSDALRTSGHFYQISTGAFTSNGTRRRYSGLGGFNAVQYNVSEHKDGEWVKLKISTKLPTIAQMTIADATLDYVKYGIQFYCNSNNPNVPLQVSQVKIEYDQNTNPVWTPAPEDIPYNTTMDGVHKINIALTDPLKSTMDIYDKLYNDLDGYWKIIRSVGSSLLDSNKSWTEFNPLTYTKEVRFTPPSYKFNDKLTSDRFKVQYSWNFDIPSIMSKAGTQQVAFRIPVGSTAKDFFTVNPTTFLYELTIPVIEVLPDDVQQALNSLPSFSSGTYVYTTSPIQPTLDCTFKTKAWYEKYKLSKSVDNKANASDVEQSISGVVSSYQTAIEQTKQSITQNINSSITSLDGKLSEQISAEIKATANNFNLNFSEVRSMIENGNQNVANINQYFDFSANGMEIGKVGSQMKVALDNEEMKFKEGETTVASISSQKMNIPRLDVAESFEVGNHIVEKYNDEITIIRFIG